METKITSDCYKILKIVYKKPNITKDLLLKKSKYKSMDELNFALWGLRRYIDHPVVGTDKYGQQLCDENILFTSDEGKIYVEEFSTKKFSDKFTRTVSVIAIIISILSLLVSVLKD